MPTRPLVEVCVSSVSDAMAAVAAGADRLELCSALEAGGLTPSVALLESVLAQVNIPVMALIRPRLGGFNYQSDEFHTALADAEWALRLGAGGVVFGFLTRDGSVDMARCREMVAIAGERQTAFHRAFDFVGDALAAADRLVELGVTRLLTSGQQHSALGGSPLIHTLVDRVGGRLTVMPGGGIRADNVLEIVEATGCSEIHLGASTAQFDGSTDGGSRIELIAPEFLADGAFRKLDPAKLHAVTKLLSTLQ